MGRAIFIGERSDRLAAIGMLVSECGAEQQERARGGEGGQGGRTLSLPHGHPSAQPISSVSQPDAPLSASALPPQPLPLPQKQLGKRRVETSATVCICKRWTEWCSSEDHNQISKCGQHERPFFGPDFTKARPFLICSKVFIRSHNLRPPILHLFCTKLKTLSAVLHCLTRACCKGYCVIVNNAPLCLDCFSGPTDANIFMFWFCTLRTLLFIIRPHNKSLELKEQKKTKTGKQKVQQPKENRSKTRK